LVHGGFDSLAAAIERTTALDAHDVDAAYRWLHLARTIAPRLVEPLARATAFAVRLQPCLRDARPEHFLFEDDRLSGLVDFGAMAVDSVAGDLARLAGEWLDEDQAARVAALAAYEHVHPLEPEEIDLIEVFESSANLLIGERWLRWHIVEGRRFDDPQAVSDGIARGVIRLERLGRQLERAWPALDRARGVIVRRADVPSPSATRNHGSRRC
jgi:homoserine kinase type II